MMIPKLENFFQCGNKLRDNVAALIYRMRSESLFSKHWTMFVLQGHTLRLQNAKQGSQVHLSDSVWYI